MHKLKSIYFYFLSISINIIKIIKKIYFKTSFYNKSLKSKTPKQFWFYPSPFLLSSMTPHKDFSFDVNTFDPHLFLKKKLQKKKRGVYTILFG